MLVPQLLSHFLWVLICFFPSPSIQEPQLLGHFLACGIDGYAPARLFFFMVLLLLADGAAVVGLVAAEFAVLFVLLNRRCPEPKNRCK